MTEQKKRGPGRPPGSKNKNSSSKSSARKSDASKSTAAKKTKSDAQVSISDLDKEKKIKELQDKRKADKKVIDEIWGVTIVAIGIFLIFCTQFKTMGLFGSAVHDVLRGLFGIMAYVLPYYFIVCAICLFFQKMQHINGRTVLFSILIFICMCLINAYRVIDTAKLAFGVDDIKQYYLAGVDGDPIGVVGMEFGVIIVKLIGKPGLLILAIAVIIISLLFVVNTPISNGIQKALDKREAKKIIRQMQEEEAIRIQNEVAKTATPGADPDTGLLVLPQNNSLPEIDFSDSRDEEAKRNRSRFRILGGANEEDADKSHSDDIAKDTNEPEVLEIDEARRTQFLNSIGDDSIGKSAPANTGMSGRGLDGAPEVMHPGLGLDNYDMDRNELEKIEKHNEEKEQYQKLRGEKPEGKGKPKDGNQKVSGQKSNKSDAEADAEIAAEVAAGSVKMESDYVLPSPDLLKRPKGAQSLMTDRQLAERGELLESTLKNFNVEAKVVQVTQGSSVTRFEVQPAVGVKVSKITALADDIALNMRAKSIRIEAPIPGKAAVGIEIENEKANAVLIRELIESPEFAAARSRITFTVGKDISGNNIVADLKEMPHLLIAGATGSGKSVCINTIITSILYKASPDQVKFVMIDPKVVELGGYNDIPHMLIPVVTDPKKAASALNWAAKEMDDRYNIFAEHGVKDLESYNEYMIANQEPEKVLPEIVIIIDELADLMMAASSQVEDAISRLAAKARAAGMHLIVATQRPSVDVVTGVIKANIPSRIAFSVSSQFDSRTILDMAGAEKLLGRGDMLFSPVGSNKPIRIQGPFISEDETRKIINYVKKQADHEYDQEVIDRIEAPSGSALSGEPEDELTEEAIAFILKQKNASVSMLQRKFRIGYNRAARIIDEIEERGIIGPADGSKPRQVLYTEDEYYSGNDIADDMDEAVEEPVAEPETDVQEDLVDADE